MAHKKPANGLVVALRRFKAYLTAQIVKARCARHNMEIGGQCVDVLLSRIVFVCDLADQHLKRVFEGNQAADVAVLANDDSDVRLLLAELV